MLVPMPQTPNTNTLPQVVVSPKGVGRLRGGHVWIYRSDLISANGVPPGAVVQVVDERKRLLGTAFYSSASQIAIRMLSPHPVADLGSLLRQRLKDAIAYRKSVVADTDAYRLVFSEGDFLPGLILDRYNDVHSMQVLTQAMNADAVREMV